MSTRKVQISLWHKVQSGEDGRKTLEKRGRISVENEHQTHERQSGEERMCTLMRNRGKKIILFHPQRENNKLFI